MDDIRYKRYLDKIAYIQSKLPHFRPDPETELEKDGILYGIQTSIEAAIDTIAMVVKDLGYEVQADKKNIDFIVSNKIISEEMGLFFKQANGMRNLLVHRYNGIEEDRIFRDIKELKDNLTDWIFKLEELLGEFKKVEGNSIRSG